MSGLASEQHGRSMVEMLGVLAIIGVLSVAGIAGYSKAMASFKRTKLIDQLSLLVTNIRATYANQPDYAGVTNSVIINMGLIEEDMKVITSSGTVSPNKIKNVYGGDITIISYSGTRTSFFMIITNIPQNACATLMVTDWGYNANNYLTRYLVNNYASNRLDLMLEQCKSGGSTNTIRIQHN